MELNPVCASLSWCKEWGMSGRTARSLQTTNIFFNVTCSVCIIVTCVCFQDWLFSSLGRLFFSTQSILCVEFRPYVTSFRWMFRGPCVSGANKILSTVEDAGLDTPSPLFFQSTFQSIRIGREWSHKGLAVRTVCVRGHCLHCVYFMCTQQFLKNTRNKMF